MADIRDSMVLAMTFSPLKTVVSLRHWPLGHVCWSSSASSLNSVGGSFHLGLLVPALFVSIGLVVVAVFIDFCRQICVCCIESPGAL